MMKTTMLQYGATLGTVLALDAIFLGWLAKGFYRDALGGLARRAPDGSLDVLWGPAAGAWLLIPLGIVLFVIPRLGPQPRITDALLWGALFGLVSFGIYDATNWATLQGWTAKLSLVDVLWGMTLCAIATLVGSRV